MFRDSTAWQIVGEYSLYVVKANGNTKKKIKRRIQKNQEAKKRGEAHAPIHSYSFVDGWEEAQKTNPSQKGTKNQN